jgi:hypothetical protein
MKLQTILALCTAALAATAAIAQDAPADPAPPAAAPGCELHVWPSSPVRSTYSGWFHGGIVDGAVQGRDGYKKLPDSILGVEAQLRTLGELDLPATLKLADYRVVLHDQPLPSRAIRAATGRLLADTPPCYAELVTDDVFFQQDLIDGRFIKAIFRFRQFDGGDAPTRSFGTYVQYRLTQFPPAEPEQLDAALEEFRLAYGQAVKEFGVALNKPPKGKKAKPKR